MCCLSKKNTQNKKTQKKRSKRKEAKKKKQKGMFGCKQQLLNDICRKQELIVTEMSCLTQMLAQLRESTTEAKTTEEKAMMEKRVTEERSTEEKATTVSSDCNPKVKKTRKSAEQSAVGFSLFPAKKRGRKSAQFKESVCQLPDFCADTCLTNGRCRVITYSGLRYLQCTQMMPNLPGASTQETNTVSNTVKVERIMGHLEAWEVCSSTDADHTLVGRFYPHGTVYTRLFQWEKYGKMDGMYIPPNGNLHPRCATHVMEKTRLELSNTSIPVKERDSVDAASTTQQRNYLAIQQRQKEILRHDMRRLCATLTEHIHVHLLPPVTTSVVVSAAVN